MACCYIRREIKISFIHSFIQYAIKNWRWERPGNEASGPALAGPAGPATPPLQVNIF